MYTEVSPEKIKLFNTNLESAMSSLTNGRLILRFIDSVLVQNFFFTVLYLHFNCIHSVSIK